MTVKPSYHWAKQTQAKDCEVIDCKEYDPIKNFSRDPSGVYVLIRPNFENARIEVAVCDKNHTIQKVFIGRRAQDIYHGIFEHEKKHKTSWFREKHHIAYLGKELKKAELAITIGHNSYYQE
jgi:hypothetical protein